MAGHRRGADQSLHQGAKGVTATHQPVSHPSLVPADCATVLRPGCGPPVIFVLRCEHVKILQNTASVFFQAVPPMSSKPTRAGLSTTAHPAIAMLKRRFVGQFLEIHSPDFLSEHKPGHQTTQSHESHFMQIADCWKPPALLATECTKMPYCGVEHMIDQTEIR